MNNSMQSVHFSTRRQDAIHRLPGTAAPSKPSRFALHFTLTPVFLLLLMVMSAVACNDLDYIGSYWVGTGADTETETETETEKETETETEKVKPSETEPTDVETETDPDSDDTEFIETDSPEVETEDTETGDTGTESTDSDTEIDTSPAFIEVPFGPSTTELPGLPVKPDENDLGLYGAWMAYATPYGQNISTYFDSEDDICFKGSVPVWDPGETPMPNYALLSVSLCYYYFSGPNTPPYNIEDCPYIDNADDIDLAGVSFYVEGTKVPGEVTLAVSWPFSYKYTAVDDSATTPKRYFFKDLFDSTEVPLPSSKIYNIQIKVDSTSHDIDYDFCIKDFALLVPAK